ncbi:hypothetical protein [Fulvimarina sp. MAC8]|uniref:hypothetical protein n=1 Tax=Fulvimarina sp. MAC8 TaxID=3162874 RepID=UPI0032ECFF32
MSTGIIGWVRFGAGAAVSLALSVGAAHAQGLAIVEAPEAGSGVCSADSPAEGFACATDRCVAESGLTELDCIPVRWCFGNGWTGDIFLQTGEGFHYHRYICDASSPEELDLIVSAICGGDDKNGFLECALVRLWDRDGNEHEAPLPAK